ncbi:uncharacterized protein LOC120522014 isoform X2 [Polypterus senegalus]|uniref:uncharacterized protein LOC120522014 isoform X2 n=1 Tax=Polypterus senegalus TaxID=55291 RepID=UPI001964E41E|nr:uncharacterized protein LOC120522014 isoform X2 [Polypterus senegalus]
MTEIGGKKQDMDSTTMKPTDKAEADVIILEEYQSVGCGGEAEKSNQEVPKRETRQSVKKTEAPAGCSTTFDKKKTDTPGLDGTTLDMTDFKMAGEVFKHIVKACSTSNLKSQDLCVILQTLVSHHSHRAGLILMKRCVKSVVAHVVSSCVRDVLTGSCLACRLGDESQDGHTCLLLESDSEEMHPCVSSICQQISF